MFGETPFQINQKSIFRLPLLHGLTENWVLEIYGLKTQTPCESVKARPN